MEVIILAGAGIIAGSILVYQLHKNSSQGCQGCGQDCSTVCQGNKTGKNT